MTFVKKSFQLIRFPREESLHEIRLFHMKAVQIAGKNAREVDRRRFAFYNGFGQFGPEGGSGRAFSVDAHLAACALGLPE